MPLRPYALLIILGGLSGLSGCQLPSAEPVSAGYGYFLLETGQYSIYDVQEQEYGLQVAPVQRTYQIKERVGQSYADVTGQTAYRLLRFRRATEQDSWQADSVWSARLVNNEAIRTENGQDFVKLLFPVRNSLSWDGNRRNASGADDYGTRNVGQAYYVQDKRFDETVTVVAQDDSTLIAQDKRIDVYARQIGLIYKERVQLQFCTATPACTGHSRIEYGIRQVYSIRTYGNE